MKAESDNQRVASTCEAKRGEVGAGEEEEGEGEVVGGEGEGDHAVEER